MQSASKSSSKHQQKVQQIENDDQPSFKPVADLQAAGINVSPSYLGLEIAIEPRLKGE